MTPVEFRSKSSPIWIWFWIAESGWIAIHKPDHVQHFCPAIVNNHFIIILIILDFYSGLVVGITDPRAQKMVSHTAALITELVFALENTLSSPQLYRYSQERNKWLAIQQRWPRIQSAGVVSGRILHFSFGPRVKDLWTQIRVYFSITAVAGVCMVIWSKTIGNFQLPRLWPVSSEISDFVPCAHAQRNILPIKYAENSDDWGLGFGV